jgi:acyl-CoA reductase-like NAD-dependent aldehyde dehydrogenase
MSTVAPSRNINESATVLTARNPSTGEEIRQVAATPIAGVAAAVDRSREAQADWSRRPIRERLDVVERFWKILSRDAERWTIGLRDEIGKPPGEGVAEVVATLDALRWIVKYGAKGLADSSISPGWQRFLLVPTARICWRPVGVFGIIGTWNYPFLLNAPALAGAILAGNGAVWKPSENAVLAGERLQAALDEAGAPEGLVTAVFGGGEIGQALVDAKIDKAVFTGGIDNGRRVLSTLAARGIPAIAELSGFDPAIVLPDASLDATARPLAWGAFVGAGQTCIAVKRVYVVGDPTTWADRLAEIAQSLRVGDPAEAEVDLGPMINSASRDRFDGTIHEAEAAGAHILSGGRPISGAGAFYPPTVLISDDDRAEQILAGCFGPVVIVRGVPDVESAIAAANASPFGLSASVWGRDKRYARRVADRLQSGMVAINDAVTPSASASAPFGGVKASGYGRVRGALGLREFANPQVVQARGAGGYRPQIFPYSDRILTMMAVYRRLFHRG